MGVLSEKLRESELSLVSAHAVSDESRAALNVVLQTVAKETEKPVDDAQQAAAEVVRVFREAAMLRSQLENSSASSAELVLARKQLEDTRQELKEKSSKLQQSTWSLEEAQSIADAAAKSLDEAREQAKNANKRVKEVQEAAAREKEEALASLKRKIDAEAAALRENRALAEAESLASVEAREREHAEERKKMQEQVCALNSELSKATERLHSQVTTLKREHGRDQEALDESRRQIADLEEMVQEREREVEKRARASEPGPQSASEPASV